VGVGGVFGGFGFLCGGVGGGWGAGFFSALLLPPSSVTFIFSTRRAPTQF